MRRRLTWLGHLLRLPNDTPARKAFREALKPTKRPRGRTIGTWISTIKKDLLDGEIMKESEIMNNFEENVERIAKNRIDWSHKIRGAISVTQRKRN